jgi:hypothetical protein
MSAISTDFRSASALALVALTVLALAGCASTRGRRGEAEPSGFLGDYSQLAPLEGYDAQEVYIRPGVDWGSYEAVQIESVTLWMNEGEGPKDEKDRQMLADLLYEALAKKLGEKYALADRPGPGVLRVRAALTQAKGAKVVLRTVSTIVPQARLLSAVVGLSADVAATVGTATAEAEIEDSLTGRRLAAAVDQRAGTKALFTTRTFTKWGDVEAACNYWAERAASFLERQGVPTKAPKAS